MCGREVIHKPHGLLLRVTYNTIRVEVPLAKIRSLVTSKRGDPVFLISWQQSVDKKKKKKYAAIGVKGVIACIVIDQV